MNRHAKLLSKLMYRYANLVIEEQEFDVKIPTTLFDFWATGMSATCKKIINSSVSYLCKRIHMGFIDYETEKKYTLLAFKAISYELIYRFNIAYGIELGINLLDFDYKKSDVLTPDLEKEQFEDFVNFMNYKNYHNPKLNKYKKMLRAHIIEFMAKDSE